MRDQTSPRSAPCARPAPPANRRADRYGALCDFLPCGYLVLDEGARILEINPAGARLLGAAPPALRGASLHKCLSPQAAATLLDVLAHSAATGADVDGAIELAAPDGGTRQVELHARSSRIRGRVRHRLAIAEVTGLGKVNVALRQAADEMRDVYQNAPCGYHSLDADGVIVHVNDTELRWLGYARDEIVGRRRLVDLMPARWHGEFEAAFGVLKKRGEVHDLQLELRRKDGSLFPVLLSATAVRDRRHRFLESRASVFDITKRRMAEEEARRYAQRLKAMARRAAEAQENERRALARELHDRIGQSLTALGINLNILEGALAPPAASIARRRLDDSRVLIERMAESVRNVMTELRPAVLDDYGLAAMLHWHADEFSRRSGVTVRVTGRDPVPRLAPPVEQTLFRIVQEALNNVAKHALASRATLRLEPRAGWFKLTVVDDGRGFDPGEQAASHRGGFGLMIMRERAEAVGGRLRVESAAARGTRVVVEVDR